MLAFVCSHGGILLRLSNFATTTTKHNPTCNHHRKHQQQTTRRPFTPIISASLNTNTDTAIEIIDHVSTDNLIQHLKSNTPQQNTNRETIENMISHLGDSRGMSRLNLVDIFGTIGSPAVPYLLESLNTSLNPVIRRSCGKALAKIGDPSATCMLIQVLVNDIDTVTRSSAAGALARMGDTAIPKLLNLISDPDVDMTVKGHAAWAIAYMQSDSNVLFDQISNDNIDVRLAVVSALGVVALGDALPCMHPGVSGDDWNDEDVDVEVKQKAVKALVKAVDDVNSEVRAEAVTALGNLGFVEHGDKIGELIANENEDDEVRRCGALSLMKLGDTSKINLLQLLCHDNNKNNVNNDVLSVFKLALTNLERLEC